MNVPRTDKDHHGHSCSVYDFVVNTKTYAEAERQPKLSTLLRDTVIESIESQFKVKLVTGDWKRLKMKVKGEFPQTVLRHTADSTGGTASSSPNHKTKAGHASPSRSSGPSGFQDLRDKFPELRDASKSASLSPSVTSKTPSASASRSMVTEMATAAAAPAAEPSRPAALHAGPRTPQVTLVHRTDIDISNFTQNADAPQLSGRASGIVVKIHLPGEMTGLCG
ncbi:hypothetical protein CAUPRSCDRAFT_12773 [Caulochytrium protostelioides]|uniref:PIH1 N-terminal domain-containing protein n=1 Tax=Caulochytrium protostelioides TaxID=1555241 RepID=A0A4P9WQS1_9FUNG|nr:hypothetical protein CAUPRSCDRAFT_12773 [Caulochytrium protostelioides]